MNKKKDYSDLSKRSSGVKSKLSRDMMLGFFRQEATERLQILNSNLVKLEKDPSEIELIDQILREAHGLKGAARMVNLLVIVDIIHPVEEIFKQVKEGNVSIDKETANVGFAAFDAIEEILNAEVEHRKPDVKIKEILKRIQHLTTSAKTIAKEETKKEDGLKKEKLEGEKTRKKQREDIEGSIRVKTSKIDNIINITGEIIVNQVTVEKRLREIAYLLFKLNEIEDFIKSSEDTESRLRLKQVLHEVQRNVASINQDFYDFNKSYNETTANMSQLISELQESALNIRMVPASTLVDTFPRLVRDIATTENKPVDFIIRGARTEIDVNMLTELKDPLIHILRNAIDHGIESSDERKKLGKPVTAKVILEIERRGDNIFIKVSDDGKGIDPDQIKETALEKEIVLKEEIDNMNPEQILGLLFKMGFSTTRAVTDISGRGIGLEVVKRKIEEKLKGEVKIESLLGKGTTFILRIPLTLVTIDAMLIRTVDQLFSIPSSSVSEVLTIHNQDIFSVKNKLAVRIRGEILPFADLKKILMIPCDQDEVVEKLYVLILKSGNEKLVLCVDRIIDEYEIVLKSLKRPLKNLKTIAGITILGTGDVVPVLNVSDLIEIAKEITREKIIRQVVKEERTRILFVEDSLVTRQMGKNILESVGYLVDTAINGNEGWDLLKKNRYSLVVTDIEMPQMNGFELCKRIRRNSALKDIPVIILTTRGSEEDKRKGLKIGADRYVIKSTFNQEEFLETVSSLLE